MFDRKSGRRLAVVLACFLGQTAALSAQNAVDRLKKEVVEAEKKLAEEIGRSSKKRAAVQLEFDALQKPDVRIALAKGLEPLVAKHRDAVSAEAPEAGKAGPAFESLRRDVSALLRENARNLADVLDESFVRNLADAVKKGEVSGAAVVGETLNMAFGEGRTFDDIWKEMLSPVFERPLRDAESVVNAAKGRLEDAENALKNAAAGVLQGMIEVPGGKYEIGDSKEEYAKIWALLGHAPNKQLPIAYYGSPKHAVELDAFYLDRNEVTNRFWAAFCRDTGRAPPPHWITAPDPAAEGTPAVPATGGAVAPVAGRIPTPGTEDCPVTWITYDAAVAYARWCGRRLPTEIEIEAAMRQPGPGEKTRRNFPFGNQMPSGIAPCNFQGAIDDRRIEPIERMRNSTMMRGGNGLKLPRLAPVGSFPEGKSALGFNDLAGNAIEMTSSPFLKYPGWAPEKVPSGVSIDDTFDEDRIVIRGGDYSCGDLRLLASVRRGFSRDEPLRESVGYEVLGFRTAASKIRGRDLIDELASNKRFEGTLSDAGPALKDETKFGRFARLDFENPRAYSALRAGGFDDETGLPARADWIAHANRATREISDAAKLKQMAKDLKEPFLIGWFRTDIPTIKPELAPGEYWVMWRAGEEKDPVTKKNIQYSEMVIRSTMKKDYLVIPNPSLISVSKSSEDSVIRVDSSGNTAELTFSFIPGTNTHARFLVALKLEAAAGAFKRFK